MHHKQAFAVLSPLIVNIIPFFHVIVITYFRRFSLRSKRFGALRKALRRLASIPYIGPSLRMPDLAAYLQQHGTEGFRSVYYGGDLKRKGLVRLQLHTLIIAVFLCY